MRVVHLSFLVIVEYLVGLADQFELRRRRISLFFWCFVWVVSQRKLFIVSAKQKQRHRVIPDFVV